MGVSTGGVKRLKSEQMNEMQDYQSCLSDPNSRKFETFSYLPEMNNDDLKKQVKYIINKGWIAAVEHTEPKNASEHYWYMWKLPMFGESDVDKILYEAGTCHKTYPNHHVRLIGYDNCKQSQGATMMIYRGPVIN